MRNIITPVKGPTSSLFTLTVGVERTTYNKKVIENLHGY